MILSLFSTTIITTGFVVAFSHAALPTHWLPFVLAGRAQKWTKAKTLLVTAFASFGHVLFTTLLGVFVVFLGIETKNWLGNVFPWIASGILFLAGAYYLLRYYRGEKGHHHFGSHGHHHDHAHLHSHDHAVSDFTTRSDKAVILSLLALLTFSPCEGFLPVYLSGIEYGWSGFILLSATLMLATMAGMVFFTWFTLMGLERLKLDVLEKYESLILGILLCLLGIIVITFEHAG